MIRTTLRSGNLTSNDEDNSLDAMSMEYSDVDNETNSTSSGEVYDNNFPYSLYSHFIILTILS